MLDISYLHLYRASFFASVKPMFKHPHTILMNKHSIWQGGEFYE